MNGNQGQLFSYPHKGSLCSDANISNVSKNTTETEDKIPIHELAGKSQLVVVNNHFDELLAGSQTGSTNLKECRNVVYHNASEGRITINKPDLQIPSDCSLSVVQFPCLKLSTDIGRSFVIPLPTLCVNNHEGNSQSGSNMFSAQPVSGVTSVNDNVQVSDRSVSTRAGMSHTNQDMTCPTWQAASSFGKVRTSSDSAATTVLKSDQSFSLESVPFAPVEAIKTVTTLATEKEIGHMSSEGTLSELYMESEIPFQSEEFVTDVSRFTPTEPIYRVRENKAINMRACAAKESSQIIQIDLTSAAYSKDFVPHNCSVLKENFLNGSLTETSNNLLPQGADTPILSKASFTSSSANSGISKESSSPAPELHQMQEEPLVYFVSSDEEEENNMRDKCSDVVKSILARHHDQSCITKESCSCKMSNNVGSFEVRNNSNKLSASDKVNFGVSDIKRTTGYQCGPTLPKIPKFEEQIDCMSNSSTHEMQRCSIDQHIKQEESQSFPNEHGKSGTDLICRMDGMDKLFDAMSEFQKDVPVEPSDVIRTSLLLHQKMALHWMIEKENTKELPPFWCRLNHQLYYNESNFEKTRDRPQCINGGILADDMGLGKTLVLISLILTNHINGKPMFHRKGGIMRIEGAENDPLLRKIRSEPDTIKVKKNKDGFSKVDPKKHSSKKEPGVQFRKLFLDQLCKSNKKKRRTKSKANDENESIKASSIPGSTGGVILLSDSDDEFPDFSNHVTRLIKSPLLSTDDKVQRVGFFGQKPNGEATLIVCPLSVLGNWTDQLEAHVSPSIDLQIYVYYGPDRVKDSTFLKQQDIILTTYLTLTNDFKQGGSPLHKINWLRVVLDEGHCIRNPAAQQTKAMRGLFASRRWLVTGTPIQNRITDLWSMLQFLRLHPFSERHWWSTQVVASIKRRYGNKPSFDRVQKIIRHVSLRRLKTDMINGEPIVKLPNRIIDIVKVKLGEDERKAYDAMQKDGRLIVCKYFKRGTNYVLRNYATVLAIIMRLRQMCCHPVLCRTAMKDVENAKGILKQLRDQETLRQQDGREPVEETRSNDDDLVDNDDISPKDRERLIQQLIQILNTGDSEDCAICLENLKEPVITRCAHVFCNGCIQEVVESTQLQSVCPMCRSDISVDELLRVPEKSKEFEKDDLDGCDDDPWISSAKIDCLIEALEELRTTKPNTKSLVVSQFTSFLSIIEEPLRERNFNFVRFDGSLSHRERSTAIEEFSARASTSPTVMLMSLTAGGVGLNLTAASRVFLLDPAWNPAVEDQCFDRCHRLGQHEDVIVTKYIVENSIEERMIRLQEQKKELINNAFGVVHQTAQERVNASLRAIITLMGLQEQQAK